MTKQHSMVLMHYLPTFTMCRQHDFAIICMSSQIYRSAQIEHAGFISGGRGGAFTPPPPGNWLSLYLICT